MISSAEKWKESSAFKESVVVIPGNDQELIKTHSYYVPDSSPMNGYMQDIHSPAIDDEPIMSSDPIGARFESIINRIVPIQYILKYEVETKFVILHKIRHETSEMIVKP